jgi:uncharacterized phage protein (TIGR01671 family)
MREIKFRAWVPEAESFIYTDDFTGVVDNQTILLWGYGDWRKLKVECVQQFTGLTDKNFKEIYEGDIVNVNHYGGTPKYETVRFYTIAGFAGIHPFTDSGHHWASHRCEIVGNIYENPELLEGEK